MKYHEQVADYYDHNVRSGYEQRADKNVILERIRADFRAQTLPHVAGSVLEIGCGPGLDVCWFATQFPNHKFLALDISPEMVRLTERRITRHRLSNASVKTGDAEHLDAYCTPASTDLVYVYFGALNTVADLSRAAGQINEVLRPGGVAVLSFVNKWYLREMLVQSLKLRFRTATARLKKTWGGYSPCRFLPSHCYSPRQILTAFGGFRCLSKKGYSIFFPAWYNAHKVRGNPGKVERLWRLDQKVQQTPLWSKGEYTFFKLQKPL